MLRSLLLASTGLLAACAATPTDWLGEADVDVATPDDALRTRAARILRPLVPGAGTPDAFSQAPERLSLALFEDLVIEAERDTFAQPRGTAVWTGHLPGWTDHEVVVARAGRHVSGLVRAPEALVRIRPLGEDLVAIDELDPAASAPDLEPVVPLDLPVLDAPLGVPAPDGGDPVIDVLIAATAPAATALGGEAGLESAAAALIAQANKGYADSGLALRIRLAGTHVSPWDESGFGFASTLGGLYDTEDGLLDDVANARDDVGADAVSLLVVGDRRACGVAYLMSSPSPAFAAAAYSVVDHRCAGPNLSFAHELGHNLGSTHDRDNAGSSSPAYPYSYGYRDADAGFRTIMAYACEGTSCPRLNRWSDPDGTTDGAPMGVDPDAEGAADNVASIALTAPVAAAWRTPVDAPEPEAAVLALPTDGATLGGSSVGFAWNDVGADAYQLTLGTTEGAADLARVDAGTATSTTVSGLPTDGRTVYATLWSEHGEAWMTSSATYTAHTATPVTTASLASPPPGSTLAGADVTFTWDDVEADGYALVLGSARFGTDLGSWTLTGTSLSVTGLPTDGRTVWATLYTQRGGTWRGETVTYRASGGDDLDNRPARLLTPTPGSALTGRSLTFTWTDAQASRYALTISNADGELYHDIVVGTSARVELSPAVRSGALTVRLASELGERWYARTATYALD